MVDATYGRKRINATTVKSLLDRLATKADREPARLSEWRQWVIDEFIASIRRGLVKSRRSLSRDDEIRVREVIAPLIEQLPAAREAVEPELRAVRYRELYGTELTA